jgi:hypothetical protein
VPQKTIRRRSAACSTTRLDAAPPSRRSMMPSMHAGFHGLARPISRVVDNWALAHPTCATSSFKSRFASRYSRRLVWRLLPQPRRYRRQSCAGSAPSAHAISRSTSNVGARSTRLGRTGQGSVQFRYFRKAPGVIHHVMIRRPSSGELAGPSVSRFGHVPQYGGRLGPRSLASVTSRPHVPLRGVTHRRAPTVLPTPSRCVTFPSSEWGRQACMSLLRGRQPGCAGGAPAAIAYSAAGKVRGMIDQEPRP